MQLIAAKFARITRTLIPCCVKTDETRRRIYRSLFSFLAKTAAIKQLKTVLAVLSQYFIVL